MAAKSYIPLAGSCMDINTQSACRGFTFQERNVGVRFSILFGYPQIKNMGVQYKATFRNFETFDQVMFFCVQDMLGISRQPFSQVDIVGIATQAVSLVWF